MEDESNFLVDFLLMWLYEGEVIFIVIELLLCVEVVGIYILQIMDNIIGCSISVEIVVDYDFNVDCIININELVLVGEW